MCNLDPRDRVGDRPGRRKRSGEENLMKWRTPKIIEIACGCEINAYFPADL